MKFFFSLFTIVILQLCLIQSREVKEQDVEEQLMEVEPDCDDSDLQEDLVDSLVEEDLDDFNAVELRARPSKRPLCVRTKRTGWGGQCLDPADLKNQSCDFIWGGDVEVPAGKGTEETCRTEEQYCCVDCFAPKQRQNCPKDIGHISDVRRKCSDGKHNLFTMDSGCNCCGRCSRTQYCRKYDGWCVYKLGDDYYNERPNNYETCVEAGNTIKFKWCEGKTCACCIPPSS